MEYFPQYNSHSKTFEIRAIENLLREADLLPPDATLSSIELPRCYCESDYAPCGCLPEALTFTWYTVKLNYCNTCGASGNTPCTTKNGKRTNYHKARKLTE